MLVEIEFKQQTSDISRNLELFRYTYTFVKDILTSVDRIFQSGPNSFPVLVFGSSFYLARVYLACSKHP